MASPNCLCQCFDGTFLDEMRRIAARTLCLRLGAGFCGLWLTAPQPVLVDRVTSRQDDATDAHAAVVGVQALLARADGQRQAWTGIGAGGTPEKARAAAGAALENVLGTVGDGTGSA